MVSPNPNKIIGYRLSLTSNVEWLEPHLATRGEDKCICSRVEARKVSGRYVVPDNTYAWKQVDDLFFCSKSIFSSNMRKAVICYNELSKNVRKDLKINNPRK